ncbi:MAG TPA: O-antigen ligase family protein [Coriobacteriia bacterium]|nr:O-antigen ligase family protein [Coriobacteriia bacterium]
MAKASPRSKSSGSRAIDKDVTQSTGYSDMNIGEKIAWVSLHALLFLVPIAISNLSFLGIGGGLPLTFDQFDIVKLFVMRACTIVGLAGWLAWMLLRGGKVRFTKVDLLILVFLAWVGLTTITAVHWPTALFGKYRRFEGFLSFINYAAVFFLTVQLVDRPARMRSLVRTLFFSGSIVMLYGALQYLGIEPVPYGQLPFEVSRSFATYGNPDLLGGFLMFMLPISIALALSEDNTAWRTIYWIGSVLTAVVTITAFTRSAWIGGTVAVAALVVAAFRQRLKPRTEDWVMAGVAASMAGVVVVRSLSAPSEVMNVFARIRSIFEFQQGSAQTRFQIWQAAWDAIKERPILGWGADTFRLVFPRFKPAAYVAVAGYISVADNVHNYPLQIASALGIPGFLLLYGLFAWILVLSFKAAFSREAASGSRIVYSGVWAAAIGYIVHLFFGLSVTGTTVLLWFCFGLLLAPSARVVEWKRPGSAVGLISAVVVVALASALFVGNVVYVMADNAYLNARVGGLSAQERVDMAERAVKLNPFNDIYRAEVGLAYEDYAIAILAGQAGNPATAQQDSFRLFQKAEESFKETIAFVPPEYDNYVFLANLYNSMGQYYDPSYFTNAAEIARQGTEVEPFGPAVRVEYARALANTGQTDEAAKQLEIAIELDPAYAGAGLLLAEIYESQDKLQEAVDVLKAIEARKAGQSGVAERIQALEASLTAE